MKIWCLILSGSSVRCKCYERLLVEAGCLYHCMEHAAISELGGCVGSATRQHKPQKMAPLHSPVGHNIVKNIPIIVFGRALPYLRPLCTGLGHHKIQNPKSTPSSADTTMQACILFLPSCQPTNANTAIERETQHATPPPS